MDRLQALFRILSGKTTSAGGTGAPDPAPRSGGMGCDSEGSGFRPIPKKLSSVEREAGEALNYPRDPDAVLRRVKSRSGEEALAVCISGLTDEARLDEFVLQPILRSGLPLTPVAVMQGVIEVGEVRREADFNAALDAVRRGSAALFFQGADSCLILGLHGFERRQVGEAKNEQTVLGPKECFTECIKTDVALIRRHIASAELVVEQAPVRNISGTRAVLVYHFSAAKPEVVEKLREKLKEMPPAVYLTGGTAEQMLFGNSLSPMPRVLLTERPDRAASHILSGRIVLLIDGSPEAVILPITLFSLMNSPEDVYMNRAVGSLLRVIRYLGALLSVLMPGYFLSLALYHQGILSTEVLSTVVASRRMVFEPIGAELILLLIIFQLIREAGQRVPGSIGQAIGIIGGLIMGQAAVSAHLASSVVLIIVAASGLGNFCIPDYRTQLAASYIRLAFVLSAWLGGLLGMTSALIVMLARLASIESFGMPYLAPLSPKRRAARPALFRGPITGGAIGRASGKSEDVM